MSRRDRSRPLLSFVPELPLYYALVGCYFFAFGMQFVIYPALVAFYLDAGPGGIGLAQTALSAPMFCVLLFGGLTAERANPGPTLARLYLAFALASAGLAIVVALDLVSYEIVIAYAIVVGVLAAFTMPVRDAALNGIIERRALLGRQTPLATAVTLTTAVQIGAQIAGILAARTAGASPAPFIAVQALALAAGAVLALGLRAPKPNPQRRTVSGVFKDLGEGVAYAFRNPVMAPMILSAAYVGVFVIGALQVLFPLLVREEYGGGLQAQSNRLGALLACFWGASFVSALILSRLKPLRHPGRAMIVSHLIGAGVLLSLAIDKQPFEAFLAAVVLWGLAAGVAISTSRTITQSASEPRYLGRVLSVYSMGFMGGAPLGSLLVGFSAEQFGARSAALFPGAGLVLAALALAVLTPLWRYQTD
jgi:MFS family permease